MQVLGVRPGVLMLAQLTPQTWSQPSQFPSPETQTLIPCSTDVEGLVWSSQAALMQFAALWHLPVMMASLVSLKLSCVAFLICLSTLSEVHFPLTFSEQTSGLGVFSDDLLKERLRPSSFPSL